MPKPKHESNIVFKFNKSKILILVRHLIVSLLLFIGTRIINLNGLTQSKDILTKTSEHTLNG